MSSFQSFERPRFFAGQLLTAEDLQREQDYHRDKARLRNRFLHGWGIVTGLAVAVDDGEITVSPGLALDCGGNELVVPEPLFLPVPGAPGRLYVSLWYDEQPVGLVPTPKGENESSSVREAVRLEVSVTDPQAGHGGFPLGGPGCGQSHALCLATLIPRGTRWRVIAARRPSRRCR